nr:flagellar hook-basal body complex protein [Limimaricola cinnabarinus]
MPGCDSYRRRFAQMVTSSTTGSTAAPAPAGVRVAQGIEVGVSGTMRATDRPTDLAIGGEGFFVVSRTPHETNEANYLLTRAGSFAPDENGNLRNAAGYFLAGFPYDQTESLGLIDRNQFADLKTVNLGSLSRTGSPTGAMSIGGNLPSQQTGLPEPGAPFVSSAEIYTPLGAAERVQFAWQPGTVENQWVPSLSHGDGTSYGEVQVEFHDSGPLAGSPRLYSNPVSTAAAPAGFAFDTAPGTATLTVNSGAVPQTVTVLIGALGSFDGMTQFSGDYAPLKIVSDGAESGILVRTEIDDRGDVYGVFDNGSRKPLYSIPLAEVANPAGLLATDGNAYLLSRGSGEFGLGQAGEGSAGTLTAGALESSNVEVAAELTGLIQTQRAYSSNARIVTTVDEMLEETTRLKR